MRVLIPLITIFLLATPALFPAMPLPPIPETQEESEQHTERTEVKSLPDSPEPEPNETQAEAIERPPARDETQPPRDTTTGTATPPAKKPAQQVSHTSARTDSELATLLESTISQYTNTERTRRGLGVLTANTLLAQTARAHSADMLARDFFEHKNPDGCSSSCRATNAGYSWRMIGENLYMLEGFEFSPEETAAMIVSGWMESPGHRANILREGYTETGVGVIVQGRAIYATVFYATPR